MVRAAWLGLLLASCALACFAPAYESGRLQCHEGRCQEGFYCAADLRCWKVGESPPIDSTRPPDAGSSNADASPGDGDPDQRGSDPGADAGPAAMLASLEVMPGALRPAFEPQVTSYVVNLPLFSPDLVLRATASDSQASLSIDGSLHSLGSVMNTFMLAPGTKIVRIQVKPALGVPRSYDVVIATGSMPGYLKAWNGRAGDRFGSALALGDSTLVVGAPAERSSGTGVDGDPDVDSGGEIGAVYVFSRVQESLPDKVGPRWARQVYLKPARGHAGQRFGESLALDQDTLVVGAPGESVSRPEVPSAMPMVDSVGNERLPEAGAAYVFVRQGGTWTQQAHLKATDARAGDNFGAAVAIFGDTVVVGAPGADAGSAVDAGTAYVFGRSAGAWTAQGTLRPSNGKSGNAFGTSLTIAGEVVVVGAPREDGGASGINPGSTSAAAVDSGAAYVFVRSATAWMQQAYIKSPHTGPMMQFGARVALAGDLLAVGAPGESSAATGIGRDPKIGAAEGSGAVFLYRRSSSSWMPPLYLKASNTEAGDAFGQSLALTANTLVVGAGGEDSSAVGINDSRTGNGHAESGAAYVFRSLPAGGWWEAGYIKSPNSETADRFGVAAAAMGDIVVVGTDGEDGSSRISDGNQADNGASNSGAVFVY